MFVSNAIKVVGCLMMLFGVQPLMAYAIVGLGAAAYSPAKYGILTELLPASQLVKANGWIEGLTIGSIILGVLLGGQLVGHAVSVHLLADEAAGNMAQLQRDDPGWARLLAQADQRVVLGAQTLREGALPRHGRSAVHAVQAVDPSMLRDQLHGVIQTWWNDEPEDLREDLREELHNSRGIPQEVDRQLLLGVRRVLERALSFQEKKMLREMVREKVLGPLANVEPASPVPAEHID